MSHPIAENEVGFVAQQGIGDHFLLCGLAAEISKKFRLNVVVASKPEMKFVADLFSGVKRHEILPWACRGRQFGAQEVAPGRWTYGHFWEMELIRAIGFKGFELLDAYRCRFGLSAEASLEQPRLPTSTELSEGESFLRGLGLPLGRTVIVCPTSRTTPQPGLDRARFKHFIAVLRQLGWYALVNDVMSDFACPTSLLPLHLFRAITLRAGGFLGVRSGLCDLVGDLEAREMVLYADTPYLGGKLYEGTKLANYPFASLPIEVVVKEGQVDLLEQAIRKHFAF